MSQLWRPASLSFSKRLSAQTNSLFLAAVARQCQLRSLDWSLTTRVVLLLLQFMWPPQKYCPGTPLASPFSDLSTGLAPRMLDFLSSVASCSFSFPLKHRIPRNHQRVFPPPLRRLRRVYLKSMPLGRLPSTPSRFSVLPGVSTTLVFLFCTHLIVAEISAPQRAYTRHV